MNKESLYSILNKNLLDSLNDNISKGLAHGKMGICIYFFILSRYEDNAKHRKIAERLLDDISSNLSRGMPIDVESGLAGIALGIRFLIKEGYQTGNINEVLDDIDNLIYTRLVHLTLNDKADITDSQLIQLLYYLYIRLIDQEENSDNEFLFKELIIRFINMIGSEFPQNIFKEPLSYSLYHYQLPLLLFVLSKLLKLGFYNSKINNILFSIVPLILSHRPLSHSYRLYLLWGMVSISDSIKSKDWHEYILNLKQQIDIEKILNDELKNQDIFFNNGVVSIYFMLSYLEENYPYYKIDFSTNDFRFRILDSHAWKALEDKQYFFNIHRGIFNGFTGVRLVLLLMNKQLI